MIAKRESVDMMPCDVQGCEELAVVELTHDDYCETHARQVAREIIAVLSPNATAGQLNYGTAEGDTGASVRERSASCDQDKAEQARTLGYVPPSADAAR